MKGMLAGLALLTFAVQAQANGKTPPPPPAVSCVAEKLADQHEEPDFLDMNENPLGPSTKALEWISKNAASAMHRYPREKIGSLKEAIAQKNHVSSDQVILDSGSDEVVFSVFKNLVRPGKNIVTPELDYFAYKNFSDELHVPLQTAPLNKDLSINVDSILKAADENTDVVLLSNPANPTGAFLDGDQMSRLAKALNSRGIKLVIDSAYREYATDPKIADPIAMMQMYPNVAVLGTFSKAYGLAGMRVGYGMGSPELVKEINAGIHPTTMTTLSANAAIEAMKDDQFLERSRAANEAGKALMLSELPKYGLQPYPTQTSFVLVKTPIAGAKLTSLLADRGIKVRDLTKLYGLQNYVRITIGKPEQIERLLTALDDIKNKSLLAP